MTTHMDVHLEGQRAELRFLAREAGHEPGNFSPAKVVSEYSVISTSACRRCQTRFEITVSLDGTEGDFAYPERCPA